MVIFQPQSAAIHPRSRNWWQPDAFLKGRSKLSWEDADRRIENALQRIKSKMSKQPSPNDPEELPNVIEKVDQEQMQHFVTTIRSAEQQVGENIIQALRSDGTVAVLTTVMIGPDGQQRIVTAALNPALVSQIQQLLVGAQQEREEEELCVGFHCLVKPKTPPEPPTAPNVPEDK